MKHFLKNITLSVVLLMFLVTTLGFSINRHHCASCNTSELYLFTHPECCHQKETAHKDTETSCCTEAPEKTCNINTVSTSKSCHTHSCCFDTAYFFKLSIEYINTETPIIRENISEVLPFLYSLITLYQTTGLLSVVGNKINDPPLIRWTGIDFIRYTSKYILYDKV